jgi:shikimate 5-dehydrogenase
MKKKWWRSKTLWFNFVTIGLGVLGALQTVIDNKIAEYVIVGLGGAGNAILRIWFTDTGIASASVTSTIVPPAVKPLP